MTKKITRDEVVKALDIDVTDDPSKLTLSAGVFTLRKEYYWRPKTTEEASFLPNVELLKNAGFEVTVIEYGDHYASFKGGEGVKKNSHRWMKFKVARKTVEVRMLAAVPEFRPKHHADEADIQYVETGLARPRNS